MSALLQPFTGFIPVSEFAHRVVGPATSMLSAAQRDTARKDPLSFRFSVGRGVGASRIEAATWLKECHAHGVLKAVAPTVLAYRQTIGKISATGILADVSLKAYDSGLVRRHEQTVAKTQRKMARYIRSTRIYGNPVALAHRPHPGVEATIAAHIGRVADTSFTSSAGVLHQMWVVAGPEAKELCQTFDTNLYITDGHHRLAAASAVAEEEHRSDAYFPAGLFSTSQLRVRSFARCVVDPSLDSDAVIARLRMEHRMEEVSAAEARPRRRFEFGVRIGARHFRLRLGNDESFAAASLDVELLQDLVLGPVFGITDPSTDRRLRFAADLPRRGRSGLDPDVWLLPFPVSVGDVMTVADSGRAMPPKSTWFAPKLPSGLGIRLLD